MNFELILTLLAILFCFYVAWNIGANDVANAVGTSVGSGALTLKQAVLIAAVFEFVGAFILGSEVSETLEGGIVNPALFHFERYDFVYGMLGSLLAAGVWLQIASYFGWPVSTTHTIVGAVLGFGLITGGPHAIFWGKIVSIGVSWLLSPVMGGCLAYLVFMVLRKKIFYALHPVEAAKQITPYLVFVFFVIMSMIILFQGLSHIDLKLNFLESFGISVLVGVLTALISHYLLYFVDRMKRKGKLSEEHAELETWMGLKKAESSLKQVEAYASGELYEKVKPLLHEVQHLSDSIKVEEKKGSSPSRKVEQIFIYLQILTACFMAFAHGSNDVANAIGPLAAILNTLSAKRVAGPATVNTMLLLLGGLGIVIGLSTWGWRVIDTVGKKITDLTPSRGFAAGFGAAITIVLASKLGLPISTTHVIVGAVLGVGLARGIGAINLYIVRDIVISWIVTVPIGAILSILFFFGLKALFEKG